MVQEKGALVTGETRRRWAEDFSARAREHWTPERTRAQLGDKRLILHPATAAPLLRALDLLRRDATMPPDSVRKFLQISHMVALLEGAVTEAAATRPVVRVLDAGCGSSYLTLLLAWCFANRWRRPAQIVGVDRNPDVIEACRRSAQMALLDDVVRFEAAPLAGLDLRAVWGRAFGEPPAGEAPVHVLLALHACDTASDDALALGVSAGADLIAVAPCCQAELAQRWAALADAGAAGPFAPIWGSPHLRREAGATVTNAMRALLLRGCGYQVTPMEFVPTAHTPKNTLLRAVRGGQGGFEDYVALRGATGGVGVALERLLPPAHTAALAAAAS